MRRFEIIVLLVNSPIIGWMLLFTPPHTWARVWACAAVLVTIVQLSVEGYRWQMLPAYCLSAGLFTSQVWPGTFGSGMLAGWLGLGCVAAAALLSTLLPVFDFPAPTGSFPVGTVILHLTDSARPEVFADDPRARRELMVQIWYPAVAGGRKAQYLPRGATNFKTSHLALVRTHAVESASVSEKASTYPLLIFCPSWNGGKAQNTFQVEDLASNGFVIAGIDHPYGSNATVFPDGRVVRTKLLTWLDMSSDQALERSTRTAEEQLRIRSQDVLFVLDELTKMNQGAGLLAGKLDMGRVGVFGHSFGGAVAAQVCWLDARFRAGINMDGLLFGGVADAGVRQPFLFMSDDTPLPVAADLESGNLTRRRRAEVLERDIRRIKHSLATFDGYSLTIQGANHLNFCDGPLFSPWKRFTGAGPINVRRAIRIVNDYTAAFFQQSLNGIHQELLDGPSPAYLEAQFQNWRRHAQ